MSYVDPTQDPENQNQNPSQVDQALQGSGTGSQPSSQPSAPAAPPTTSAGGGSGTVSGGGAPSASPATPDASKPSTSGSWTNLDQYLNQNADQGATVGNQIASTVNNQGTQAQNDITNLGVNFNSAVNADTTQQNSGAVNQAITDASSLKAGQTLSAADQAAYNAQAGASYSGPTDATGFSGYNQAQTDTNTAQQSAGETQSESGRDVLLNNQYENTSANGYNQGENNLDQLLLEDSAGGQSALQPLAQQWSGLNGALNNTVSAGNAAAQNAVTTDQATSAAATGALGTANTNFQNQLNTGLTALQTKDTNSYNQILAALKSGALPSADYAALGIDPSTHIYAGSDANGNPTGLNTQSYLSQGSAPTLQTYATADQYAQAQALAQLSGQSSSGFLAPGSVSQAGTAETAPAYSFNTDKFTADNNTQQAEYANTVTNIQNSPSIGWTTIPVSGGYSVDMNSAIPTGLTSRTDLSTATPKDIVSYWIPLLQKASAMYGGLQGAQIYPLAIAQLTKAIQNVNAVQQEYGLPAYYVNGLSAQTGGLTSPAAGSTGPIVRGGGS